MEENERSIRRLLFGLKSRWQKAQSQVFANSASLTGNDNLGDGFYVLDCEKEDCIGRRLRVRRDEMNALTQQISKSNTLSNAAVASKSGSGDAQEENLPILQSAAKQWKDKIVASALEVKSSVSENNISNENPEELDGDLTESDEDEETMQKELERLREEGEQI